MRVYLVSCIVAAIIALGAAAILHYGQESAETAFATEAVRL